MTYGKYSATGGFPINHHLKNASQGLGFNLEAWTSEVITVKLVVGSPLMLKILRALQRE
jgi:hypothetical protein